MKKENIYWRRLLCIARMKATRQEMKYITFSAGDLETTESAERRAMEIVKVINPSLYERGMSGYEYRPKWATIRNTLE